ncbi:thiamine diphosphokinase [Bacteroidales bacterium OttesenSCG-928-A17]|nr:thiamine diphosphokinase [Bacteroidales bacterium OttesenSCG-928-A17]
MIPIVQPFLTIILADGAFPQHSIPLEFLKKADRIVCCDGSAEKLLKYGIQPTYIVGDMDTLSEELKTRYASIIHFNPDQETNDLTKAVQFCKSRGWNDITILGASGNREDHLLGNLSLLTDYAENVQVQLFSDYGSFVPQLANEIEYESYPGEQVSIFSLNPEAKFISKNLRYPLDNRTFTSWWQGTLNEAVSDSFAITIDGGKALLFREY